MEGNQAGGEAGDLGAPHVDADGEQNDGPGDDVLGRGRHGVEVEPELFTCCDSPLIAEAYERYGGKIAALRNHLAVKPQHTYLSFAEHIEMRDWLAARAIDDALAVLDRHIERTKATYAAWVEDIAAADREAEMKTRDLQ